MSELFPEQWPSLLQHLGDWKGSFTRLSPDGNVQKDTPTLVSLEGLNENKSIRQTIRRFDENSQEISPPQVLQYSTLNRGTLFFANGAFSVGAMQFSPVSEFGAELGFIHGDRRLRLVPLFTNTSELSSITLIREFRQDTAATELPPLSIEQLLGTWEGKAIVLYPDWRSPDTFSTRLLLERQGDRLSQTLSAPGLNLTSTAIINGSIVQFSGEENAMRVLLLPDGASCTIPAKITNRKPFFLEVGWLVKENLRYRLIRRYDERGGWVNLTLVTERKVTKS
ncbi:MAG: DUF3598 family protein [Cyanobacteriota bacterium]|nr:DUF3598 family protein [Cyanobacteriota bacterium]